MPLKNTTETYGSPAKLLHWLMFLMIASLLAAGFVMVGMENTPDKFKLYGLHKSLGITVLTLVFLRLAWRLMNITPILPDTLSRMQKFMAHAAHWGLYALMVAMPMSGWLMSSAAGFTVSVFGWFSLPNLVEPDKALFEFFKDAHEIFAWALILLVAMHAAAALLHHFYYKDNILRRMLPWVRIK
jgi:cytochrome b561